MSEDAFRNEYDDLTDLSSMQMESVREWEMQFTGLIKGFSAYTEGLDGGYQKSLIVRILAH